MARALKIVLAVIGGGVALQVGNHVGVHLKLCGLLECSSVFRPAPIDARWRGSESLPAALRSSGVQAVATTALLRRKCNRGWDLSFGVRIDVEPFAFGESIASDGGCAEAGLDGVVRGELVNTRLSSGDCSLVLQPLRVTGVASVRLDAESALDADAAAACADLLSLDRDMAQMLVGARFALTAEYGPFPSDSSQPVPNGAAATASGWLRSKLWSAPSSLQLTLAVQQRDASFAFATRPPTTGSSSPELSLDVTDNGLLEILPGMGGHLGDSGKLNVVWNLDHETASVVLNGSRIERAPQRYRPAGRTDLAADGCREATAQLFFVEANDEGQANEDQLNAVFETVEARGDAGVIVAVLVHGWQHSAKPGDSYVCRFAALIRSVEQMEETRAAGRARRDVVGVYVGWPGALYPEDLANGATTFWNRLEVADRLGADGAVLPRLIRGLGERLPGSRNGGADRSSALVVAGHSLGGRAVFAAVRSDVVDGADSRRPDLVLLMNPAFSADIYAEVHARRCAPGVPLLSFSSRTDGVTRRVYPAGQTLTYPYEADAAPAFIEHIYTAANYESYLTHRLRLEPVAGMPPEPEDEQTILRGPQRVPLAKRSELYDDTIVNVYAPPQGASDAVWYTMRLERADAAADCAPEAKVIEVDPRILPNHSDIFTPSFMEYAVRALNKSLGPRQ